MTTPAVIYIVLTAIGTLTVTMNHGKEYTVKLADTVVAAAIVVGLLLWGGFWAMSISSFLIGAFVAVEVFNGYRNNGAIKTRNAIEGLISTAVTIGLLYTGGFFS
jgi:hypothetical protein